MLSVSAILLSRHHLYCFQHILAPAFTQNGTDGLIPSRTTRHYIRVNDWLRRSHMAREAALKVFALMVFAFYDTNMGDYAS